MEWKDLEKMTVPKLREEALKYPQIEAVHGKNKSQLMNELAHVLGIERPHVHLSERSVHTQSDLKHKLHELKAERDKFLAAHDHTQLHAVRREMHSLKHAIRKIEAQTAQRGDRALVRGFEKRESLDTRATKDHEGARRLPL